MGLIQCHSPMEAREHQKSSYIETVEVGGFIVGDKEFQPERREAGVNLEMLLD